MSSKERPEVETLAEIIAGLTATQQALLYGFAQGVALASTLKSTKSA